MTLELSIIIPTYNEKDNIPILLHRIEALGMNSEIIVVDDNSNDGTAEVVQRLSAKYNNIHLFGENLTGTFTLQSVNLIQIKD